MGVTAVEALRELVAACDSWPGSWKLVAFSTPVTIFTDLGGARFSHRKSGEGDHWAVWPYQVEQLYLQRVGRLDLLPKVSGVPSVEAGGR